MPITQGMKDEIYAAETGEAILMLLTIDHDDFASPIRVVNNTEDIPSNGETFIAFNFELTLPADDPDTPPQAKLVIGNVDREIVRAIRSTTSAPTCLIEVIKSSTPDTIEATYPLMDFTNPEYDALTVSVTLTVRNLVHEPYPAANFDPSRFPGLF